MRKNECKNRGILYFNLIMTQSIANLSQVTKSLRAVCNQVWCKYGEAFVKEFPGLPCVVIGEMPTGWKCQPREWIQIGGRNGHYRSTKDLFNDRPEMVGRCTALINWVPTNDMPKDDDFPEDVKCIALLEPCSVLFRGTYNYEDGFSSFDGTPHLRRFLQDPASLGYSLMVEAELLENDANYLGGEVTIQYFVHNDFRFFQAPLLPSVIEYVGVPLKRRSLFNGE